MYYRKYSGIPTKTQTMAENSIPNDNMSDNTMKNDNSEVPNDSIRQGDSNGGNDNLEMPSDNARQGDVNGGGDSEMPSNNTRQGDSGAGGDNLEMPTENIETAPPQKNAENSPYSGSINSGFQNDFELMQATYTAINKALLPYVKVVVAEYAYEGSPALRDIGPDKEYITQMVIRILELAQNDIDEIEEIRLDSIREPWNELQLLYNIAEALVLTEIYFIKRKNMQI